MNIYDATIPVFTKFLNNLDRWFDKAAALADAKKFEIEVFAASRLAPDQYSLTRQVQSACDQAKFTVAKLTGTEPPAFPDTEKTVAELRQRIKATVEYLATFTREAFDGAEDRSCTHAWMGGKSLRGVDYLNHFALANFYFHLTTAYGILRHNGVPLGKMDFVAALPFQR